MSLGQYGTNVCGNEGEASDATRTLPIYIYFSGSQSDLLLCFPLVESVGSPSYCLSESGEAGNLFHQPHFHPHATYKY